MTSGASSAENGFRAAFLRFCQAKSFDDMSLELSNMLNHLYRLSEAAKAHHGTASQFYLSLNQTQGGAEAAAILWARTFDAHQLFDLAEPGDLVSDYVLYLVGAPIWKGRRQLPPPDARFAAHGRDLLYDSNLAGKPVPDTLQAALGALLTLVPTLPRT